MDMNKAFPSKFLKATDIDEMADPDTDTAVLRMTEVRMTEVGEDEKPVLYFSGTEKGLVLNKTNTNTIIGLYGKATEDWEGKAVGLFTTEVGFQGQQ